ncbi:MULTISPECIES: sce7726 family protein [Chryseobacterium]|jgi:hypothetical protein|uniref:sce7726 family protein n=1 Tax=Chryseobacterium TaxID=59732 RepID=UPI001628CC0B|nr:MULTISPECIES: sce7726 family protein [Chryseobacterium]MDR3026603.1 sce7726 family protein [Chryseobacterium sp.]
MKDIDIRNSLKSSILSQYTNDSGSLVIDEFNVSLGIVRADIAVINGVMHAYEIKSEKDNLKRLENQLQEYYKFFEYVTVVTCEKYLNKVLEQFSDKCGVIVALKKNNLITFKKIRRAKKNKCFDKISLVKALWKEEIIDILESIKYNKKGFKSKSKPLLYQIMMDEFNESELLHLVKNKLKERTTWKAGSQQTQSDDYFPLFSKL